MSFFSFMVNMGLNATAFHLGVKQAESGLTRMTTGAVARASSALAGVFTVGAAVGFIKHSVDAADRIGDLADKFSLTTDEVQKLDIVAKRSGLDIEQMGQMFLKVGEERKKAGQGDVESLALLKKMGVSVSDIHNPLLKNKDIAEKISDTYEHTNKTAADQADLVAIAGTRGEKLLSVLQGIKNLGPVRLFSEEDIKSLSDFNDSMAEIKRQGAVAGAPFAKETASIMGDAMDATKGHSPGLLPVNLAGAFIVRILDGFFKGKDTAGGVDLKALDLKAALEKRKADRADLYPNSGIVPDMNEGLGDVKRQSNSLNSIGGFFFDAGKQEDAFKSIKRNTDRTATAVEKQLDKISKNLDG